MNTFQIIILSVATNIALQFIWKIAKAGIRRICIDFFVPAVVEYIRNEDVPNEH